MALTATFLRNPTQGRHSHLILRRKANTSFSRAQAKVWLRGISRISHRKTETHLNPRGHILILSSGPVKSFYRKQSQRFAICPKTVGDISLSQGPGSTQQGSARQQRFPHFKCFLHSKRHAFAGGKHLSHYSRPPNGNLSTGGGLVFSQGTLF